MPPEQELVRQKSLQKWASASKRMFPSAYSPEGPVALTLTLTLTLTRP